MKPYKSSQISTLLHPLDFALLPVDWLGKSLNTDPSCDAYDLMLARISQRFHLGRLFKDVLYLVTLSMQKIPTEERNCGRWGWTSSLGMALQGKLR